MPEDRPDRAAAGRVGDGRPAGVNCRPPSRRRPTHGRRRDDDKPNKRRHARFLVEGVQGRMVFASQVEILNLSLGGVAIKADRRLNIGGDYTLKLELAGEAVDIKGVVVWSVMSGMHKAGEADTVPEYSAGLRFKDVFTERVLKLMAFIDRHKVFEEHRVGGLRFRIDAPGKALLDTPEEYRVRLISRSGMLIETAARSGAGSRLSDGDLAARLRAHPLRGPRRLRARGRPDPPAHYEFGIEFLSLQPEDDDRLQAFIEALAKDR